MNSVAVLAYKAVGCHAMYVMALYNQRALEEYAQDELIRSALARLLELTMLIAITEQSGDWMDILTSKQVLVTLQSICQRWPIEPIGPNRRFPVLSHLGD